jgi:hypothetical protein
VLNRKKENVNVLFKVDKSVESLVIQGENVSQRALRRQP